MGQLTLSNPMEIARDGEDVILVAAADVGNLQSIDTMAQIWRPGVGYFAPERLQVMLRFLYDFQETVPPVAWVEPTT